jgi:hypothetical protein
MPELLPLEQEQAFDSSVDPTVPRGRLLLIFLIAFLLTPIAALAANIFYQGGNAIEHSWKVSSNVGPIRGGGAEIPNLGFGNVRTETFKSNAPQPGFQVFAGATGWRTVSMTHVQVQGWNERCKWWWLNQALETKLVCYYIH